MRVCSSARKAFNITRGRYSVTIRGGLVFVTAPRNCKIFGWRSRSSIKSSTWSLVLTKHYQQLKFQIANQISSLQGIVKKTLQITGNIFQDFSANDCWIILTGIQDLSLQLIGEFLRPLLCHASSPHEILQ